MMAGTLQRRFSVLIFFCSLLVTGLQVSEAGAEEEVAHLANAITAESPPTGGEIALDTAEPFRADGGWALIQSEGGSAELLGYAGVAGNNLTDIERPASAENPVGSTVLPVNCVPTGTDTLPSLDTIVQCLKEEVLDQLATDDLTATILYPCILNQNIPCYSPIGTEGGSVVFYDQNGDVLFEETIPGTLGTCSAGSCGAAYLLDELANGRAPVKGSATVSHYWEQRTLFLQTAYRWNQEKHWSWKKGTVTSQSHTAFPSHMDTFQSYEGQTRDKSNYAACWFTPWNPRSCHLSDVAAQFCNDLPFVGCVSRTHPWVSIDVNGYGGYNACAWEESSIIQDDLKCKTRRHPPP